MTEGPTARLRALLIEKEVLGETLRNILARTRKTHVRPSRLIGKKLDYVDTFGKNIVLGFSEYAIRIHLMMYGTIHIYGPSDPFLKPERQIRLLLDFDERKVVVYNAPIVQIGRKSSIVRMLKKSLGEDPLRDDWNPQRAISLILRHGDRKIGDLLLDQRVIAGIGNILRNEILFRAKIHPERAVRDLSPDEIRRIVTIAKELSEEFLRRKLRGERLRPILYVYNKYGKPCPICGRPIRYYRQEPHRRKTFVCENCQK
mgnify:CR=1 FL=1